MQELVAAASRFEPVSGVVSTIDGVDRVVDVTTDGFIPRDVGTADGDLIPDLGGFWKQDPPAIDRSVAVCATGLL